MFHFSFLALASLSVTISAHSANTTLRYIPFDDSITEIICWRSKLWQKLQSTPDASTDFVGSGKTENNCRDTKYDRDNEGHSGFLAIDIVAKNQLEGWLKVNPADVITMHLGTNDIVQQNKQVTDIIAAFTKLIATMRTSNPRMKIVVAQIIPIQIGSFNTKIAAFNAAITPWAVGLNTSESPIWVVDQNTGFNRDTDLRDGVHPNDRGDEKMVNVWFLAVLRALEGARVEKGMGMVEVGGERGMGFEA